MLSYSGFSQTIINAERIIDTTKTSISALELSYHGSSGNLETNELGISPVFILLKKKNEYNFFGGYTFQSASGSEIQNSGFLHFRHNYKLSTKLKTFEFFQIQNNNVLLLKERIVFGAGLRYSFIKKDSLAMDMELGLMRELEKLDKDNLLENESDSKKNYRITYVNSFKWKLSKSISINNVVYYQPNIKSFNDFRILNDLNFIVSITDHISFITNLNTRFDNKPPGALESVDNSVRVGLNMQFFKLRK